MGRLLIEFRGLSIEVKLDDEKVERIYNALPMFALEKGQTTLSEVKSPKPEEKQFLQKPISRVVAKFPTKEDVRDYIKTSSPNYEFSLPLVCKHFIGFVPTSRVGNPERKIYDKMWDRIRKAKQIIDNEENGKWNTMIGEEGETIYRFEKTDQKT